MIISLQTKLSLFRPEMVTQVETINRHCCVLIFSDFTVQTKLEQVEITQIIKPAEYIQNDIIFENDRLKFKKKFHSPILNCKLLDF